MPSHTRLAWAFLFVVALWQPRILAQSAENVLLVANDASAVSQQIADYYARKRAIPASQVLRIRAPVAEEIDRTTFTRAIEAPISEWLTRHRAQDRILYIVLTKDVPLNIGDVFAIQFVLDDDCQSVIHEEIIIRRTNDLCIGAEFSHHDTYKYELDFYLSAHGGVFE